ncbi:DUF1554 domain-containing protein [Leptospira fluminis]|uniref:DUF1554 domain-containing protein n=1 Tax=Leptospira fluminis TaxID=2484979 RepID=A0A4R9GN88_9LEPT|nr:DUF1554 domain-containing protein [Leptospira fluminis]TGK15609.1 DUF1554 domain-containing protein [Leptospira fluminis]
MNGIGKTFAKLRLFILACAITSAFTFCSKPFPEGESYLLLSLLQSGSSNPQLSYKYVFVTSSTSLGSLGGVAGADSICSTAKSASAASLPGLGSEYNALLVGTGRVAGGAGWPLKSSTTYYLNYPNPSPVFTTTAGALPGIPLAQALPGSTAYWTGLSATWTTGSTCLNWTDGTFANTGDYGSPGVTSMNAFNNTFANNCNTAQALLCVRL